MESYARGATKDVPGNCFKKLKEIDYHVCDRRISWTGFMRKSLDLGAFPSVEFSSLCF